MEKVVFIHIPKTGGTTMKYVLASVYWGKIAHEKIERKNMKGVLLYKKRLQPFNYSEKHDKKFNCIIGHFPLSKYEYLKKEGWLFATWLRDPVERIISIWSKTGHKEFSTIKKFTNVLNNSYKTYLNTDLDILDFVGFTETYEESLNRFKKLLGVNTDWYEKKNITPKKLSVTEREKNDLKIILKNDYKIYNELKEKYYVDS